MFRLPSIVAYTLTVLALAAGLLLAGCGGQAEKTISFDSCAGLDPAAASSCISGIVNESLGQDPNPAQLFKTVDRVSNRSGGQISGLCHGAMHQSGREFAQREKVSLDNLQNYLPQSDGPNCSDGFVHGLFMALNVQVNDSQAMLKTCATRETRRRQYACIHGIGHAFRRTFLQETDLRSTLKACKGLGRDGDLECAAGAYHDYFLAAAGRLDTPRPDGPAIVEYCQSQPKDYLAQCWYRLFQGLKLNNPPDKAGYIAYLCGGGLKGIQRRSCITGAATKLIKPDKIVDTCSQLKGRDSLACLEEAKRLSWSSLVSNRYIADNQATVFERRQRDFSTLLDQCSRFKSRAGDCAYLIGLRSVRILPEEINPQAARALCDNLAGAKKQGCKKGVNEALRSFASAN